MKKEQTQPNLIQCICDEMKSNGTGTIPFRRYMELCLYHPDFGYYTSNRLKVGKQGDFYTSSGIGGVMGEMLAAYAAGARGESRSPWTLVEWGGGSGSLAKQILDTLRETAPRIYELVSYVSIEASGFHRQLQRELLAEHEQRVEFMDAESWLAGRPHAHCIVIANELLDAFPVHRLIARGEKWHEVFVGWDEENGQFFEQVEPHASEELESYIEKEQIRPREGQQIEINLEASRWTERVGRCLAEGSQLIAIDYGDVSGELYAAHRMNGTLLCYWKHQANDNPYTAPGEQDITAHVNFSACLAAGEQAGLNARLMTQKQFLLECGILERLQNHAGTDPFSPASRKNRAIRQLLLSDQMSELFKVLLLRRC